MDIYFILFKKHNLQNNSSAVPNVLQFYDNLIYYSIKNNVVKCDLLNVNVNKIRMTFLP